MADAPRLESVRSRLAPSRPWIAIIASIAVMVTVQLATNSSQEAQDIIFIGYFVPIFIAARYLPRRSALLATAAATVIYTSLFIPRLLDQTVEHPELIEELASRWAMFITAGVGLTGFRASIAREKERALSAEREHRERLDLMLDISRTVSSSLKIDHVLQVLAVRIAEAVGSTYCRICLLDEDGQNLNVIAAYPARKMQWDSAVGNSMPLSELPDHRRAIESQEAAVVGGRRGGQSMTPLQEKLMYNVNSLLLYPLVVGGQSVGVVAIGEQRSWNRSPLDHEKADLCQTIVNQGAVAVGHALTHEALEEAFTGTIRSLAEAIDAKDPSTRGHSDWVSKYAVMLGRQMALDNGSLDVLKYAGYLHDIGKIGIPDTLLGKAGQLSAGEWKLMKKHPIVSAKILEPVRISPAVKAAVRHHHERYDGKGYPYGLAGEAIPLEARIMAVADSYEAMTSDRPYRKALSDEQAAAELKRCAGTQFDPVCVDAFLRAMGRKVTPLTEPSGNFEIAAG